MNLDEKGKFWKYMLAAGVSSIAMGVAAPAALAQAVEEVPETTEEAEEERDEVVITGSRIRRRLDDQTIAITDIDQEEFQFRGFVNAIEALEELPLVGPGVNNQGNATQNGDNNAFVDLLNFGTQRTLTLIDGRRSVSSNQGTVFVPANATGAQVDLTIINPALIKRTEIQTVGSGPIYGADAVAGVVNVILNRDFDGLEFSAQGGITQRGDGGNYRVSGAWGKELFGGRGRIILAGEWLDSEAIYGDAQLRSFTNEIQAINNPLSTGAADEIPDQLFQANTLNPQLPVGGLIATGQTNAGGTANFFFPTTTGNSARDAQFNAFVAATGLTPFQFAIANPDLNGINPLAFAGTFGLTSGFTTVPNTDPASLALGLDRVAVPLTFDSAGNPVPFDIGGIVPPTLADQNSTLGGGGFGLPGQQTIRAAQERISFNALWKYEVAPNIRYEGDFLFSNIENEQRSNGSGTQTPGAAITSGNAGVPIFFNENPFVTPATLAALQDIEAQNGGPGSVFGNFAGSSPAFFLTRSLFDVTGGFDNLEGNRSRTFRTAHALFGEFEALDRAFNWDIAFSWSRNTSQNRASTDILDIEFALATDVVADASGNPVCRQQTLAAPEAVDVRNPFLTNINIATGLTPTQAQIDACVPLNLFGFGAPSQAAIDYVTANGDSENRAEQFFGEIQFGGEVIQLPAGPLQFSSTFQWRRESLVFTPNDVFGLGLARQTIGQASDGFLRFFEGGTEINVPVFGSDFSLPGFRLLDIDGAVRVVNRGGTGTPNGVANDPVTLDGVTDVAFTAGGRYSPIEGVTFRGNRTRSIRSASITETLGAPQTGFSGIAQFFACNAFFVNGGPASGIRAQNCSNFEQSLGLAPGTFAGLTPGAGTVPAGVGGNPGIQNEISNNWSVGVVLEPSFIPNLVISSDYLVLQLDDEIDLAFFGLDCFDQAEFPNSVVGGAAVCEGVTLAVEDPNNPGQFIIPENNLITGNPTIPPGIPGTLAPVQEPFTVAAAQFVNVNSGSLRLRALNSNIRYSFDLNDVTNPLGFDGLPDLGSVRLNGNVYYIRDFQSSNSGDFAEDVTNLGGEPGNETFQTRLDVSHRIGKFSHTLRWIRDAASVENVDDTAPLDEEPDFFRPSFNQFNYTVGYEFTDNFQARFIVNNLTDARELPQFGIAGALGRNFLLRVDARF